jgi:peroxiredoxin
MALSVGTKAPDFTLKSKQASGIVDVKLSAIKDTLAKLK